MNNPKAQFQINNGSGWQTIAEADIINGIIPPPPNAWTMARAMRKQVVHTGYTPEKITVVQSDNTPRDTHFVGFAKALFQEMQADLTALYVALGSGREQDVVSAESVIQQLIARRTYDLALHVLINLNGLDRRHNLEPEEHYRAYLEEMLTQDVPDMPELPKVKG